MLHRILMAVVAFGMIAVGTPAFAQSKQVAVLSLASYEDLIEQIDYLGSLAGQEKASDTLEGMLNGFTGGQGTEGLDKEKPWGVAVLTDGQGFQIVGMVPVADFDKLISAIGANLGEPAEKNGVYQFQGPLSLAIKHQGDWAYLAQGPQHLASLPKDPSAILGPIATDYSIGLRFFVANIPEAFREQGLAMIKGGLQMSLQQQEGETDAQFEVRRGVVENQLAAFEKNAKELDQITLGLAIDPEDKQVYLDIDTTVVAGSNLAKQLAAQAGAKTKFAGFLSDENAAYFNVTSKLGPDDIKQTLESMKGVRAQVEKAIDDEEKLPNDEAKASVKKIVGTLLDSFEATIKTGSIDGGGALQLGDTLTFAAGGYVADGAQLDKAFRDLVKLAEKEPDFPGVKFDAAKHKDVRFHTLTVPVKDDEDAQKVLGENLDIVIGIGPKAGYLAFGADGLDELKTVIDASGKKTDADIPPVQVNVSLGRIFKFAASKGDEPQVAAMAEALAESDGEDHVTLTVVPVTNGQRVRLLLEEGVLKLIGQAGKMSQAQAAGAGGGF
jgi:hypothetical protein